MQNFVNIRYIYICIYLYIYIYIQVRDSEGGIQKFADTTLNLLDLVLNIFVFAPKKRILPPPRITCSYGADVLSQDVLTLQWLDGSGAVKQLQVMLASVSFQHGEMQTRKLMGSNTRVFLYGDTTCEGYDTCLTARGLELQVSQSLCPASQLGDLVKYLKSRNMDKANKGENHSGLPVVFLGAFGAGYHLKV